MKIVLVILAILAAALVVLMLIPIRLEVDFKRDAVTNKVTVTLKYARFKFRLFNSTEKKDKPHKKTEKKPKEKQPFSFEREKAKIEKYIKTFESIKADIVKTLQYMARRAVVFDNVEVESEFGFSDAMHTGIFTGILNGFVYGILGVVHHHSKLRQMNVNLQPVFEKTCFDVRIRCILHLKTVHTIVIAVNVLKILRKIKKAEGSE